MSHDVQSATAILLLGLRDSNAVVAYRQNQCSTRMLKAHGELRSVAVFDRVRHRFLADAVKMNGGVGVLDEDRFLAFEKTCNRMGLAKGDDEVSQSADETIRPQRNRIDSAREIVRLIYGLVDQLGDLRGAGRKRRSLSVQVAFQGQGMKQHTGKALP